MIVHLVWNEWVLCFNKCMVYLVFTCQRKHLNASFECAVALLCSIDARLRLDLVGIEGPEGHTESLWYQ